MTNFKSHMRFFVIALIVLLSFIVPMVQAQTSANYLYRLSDFNGPVESLWARIAIDKEIGEVYTLNRVDSIIQIYNPTAMQTFGFGEEFRLASSSDIAVGSDGDIFVLYRHPSGSVQHFDYRGKLIGEINVDGESNKQLFKPDFLDYHAGKLYLADSGSMQVLVTGIDGVVEQHYDFRSLIAAQIKQSAKNKDLNNAQRKKIREDLNTLAGALFGGFSVDSQGNIYFTVASFFTAYRFIPQNDDLKPFGIPGSGPGKFGVVASICADRQGNIYVSDRLRSVVLMFDSALTFQTEFGYRGSQPHNLVVPDDLAIDEKNQRIYVSQAANRGISVFALKSQ